MNKAYWQDIWRTIVKSKKRFISILIITMLGVTMLTGLRAGCVDLRNSADDFYDKQKLYDIQVVSTLGLEDEDISALSNIDEIDQIVGSYSETHILEVQDKKQSIQLNAITKSGINEPYVLDGSLPKNTKEIAVSEKFLRNSGKKIGDTITFSDDDSKLKYQTFTICGVILDAMNISVDEGATSFRSTSNVDDTFYVQLDAFDYDVYTSLYMTLKGSKDSRSYSDTYKQMVHEVMEKIEKSIKTDRENARYQMVVDDAWKQYDKNKDQMDNEFSKGDEKLASAREELENGRIQLQKGWQELQANEQFLQEQSQTLDDEMANAYTKLQNGFTQLDIGKQQLDEAMKQVQDGEVQLTKAKDDLKTQQDDTLIKLDQKQKEIEAQIIDLKSALQALSTQETSLSTSLQNWPHHEWETYIDAVQQAYQKIAQLQLQIQALSQQQSDDAKQQIEVLTITIQRLQETLSQQYELQQQQLLSALSIQIEPVKEQLEAQLKALDITSSDYETQKQIIENQIQVLETLPQAILALGIQKGQIQANLQVISNLETQLLSQKEQAVAGFSQGFSTIQEKEQQLQDGKEKTLAGYKKLYATQSLLEDSQMNLKQQQALAIQKLNDAKQQLESGKQQLLESEIQLQDGEKELSVQQHNYDKQKEEAQKKLAEGKADIEKIDKATWYVQDRNAMDSYTSVESDASSIETVGTAFPIIFLIVAILISLTTITRMVEEERGLIGTYKALGFSDMSIYSKYLIYAFSACFIGGILGDACGFWLLPKFLFTIFQVLYKIPEYQISFDFIYGVGGVLLFVVGIMFATIIACRLELSQMPAVLMRPKAPRAGSRVILEYIPMIWKRLSFLNKVTMRNLFRFKKRMFMTIGGIMGCTALILCGFAIKDSVNELMPEQYEKIYQYDFMSVVASKEYESMKKELVEDQNIKDLIGIRMDNVKVKSKHDGQEESVSMMVIPNGESIEGYIGLEDTNGKAIALNDGIYITENVSTVLGFDKHDHIFIQNMDLIEQDVEVQKIVQNYLGNMVYMNQKTYESLFGKYEGNGYLAHFKDGYEKQTQFVETFSKKDHVLSAVSVKALRDQFSDAFTLINAVVYLITFMAAGLAFVVLFTLSTTNISERERELATIKVLGFFDKEVHLYVNKETVILTGIGILCGLPLGRVLSGMLTSALKMPSIHFAVTVYPVSYLYAALLSLGFALIVNFMTNRTLNQIDMVEALKSIE
ncbi:MULTISPECIES: FtsX-like permease family protein [unclassified Amedibacterium]|uniref:FtsX-like permease family protein n=1 Tax=unclassified Amedibacterium TaxID=3088137 RepID=UPI000E3F4EB0|nr:MULTISPECIES: FtsX-like permease family protein [unclassified Absiella]RGB63871.1 hypothetical protein DW113_17210 [Absiella sp. AM09-45]RGB78521.1 hypothetical protein DW114_05025 [Absiella sp. AM09-50]